MKSKFLHILMFTLVLPFGALRAADKVDDSDDFEARLKKAREVPKVEKNSKGGGFVTAGLGVGQAYSADKSSNPGIAFLGHFQPGLLVQNNSWDRFEVSLDVFFGNLNVGGDTKFSVPVFGLTPKFGYGYSLGTGMFGVVSLFGGAATGRLDGKYLDMTLKSDSAWGIVYGGGYDLVFDVSDRFEFITGLSIAHHQYNFSGVKINDVKDDNITANLNVPQLTFAARIKF